MFATLMLAARTAIVLVKRPGLLPTAFRQIAALAPRRWWASGSHLPIPRADYMAFRNTTLSGDPQQLPQVHDVIVYLEWCRSMHALPLG